MKEAFKENKIHGTRDFPFIVYRGKIPEYIRSFPMHWHEEFEIIYIVSGTGYISVQNVTYTCCAGDIFLIPPGYIHAIFQYETKMMEYFNILYRFSLLEPDENSVCYKKYFSPYVSGMQLSAVHFDKLSTLARELTPHILSLIDERKKSDGYELMVKSHLFAVMNYVYAYISPAADADTLLLSRIKKFKNTISYVHDHYAEQISIEKAASVSNISPGYFMKCFREFSGKTFIDYVNSYRLGIAAEELKTTDKSVIEISGDCGFRNFSYFIRSFKKEYGKTPLAYRHVEGIQ